MVQFTVIQRDDYFECLVTGESPDEGLGYDPYADVPDGSRILVDARGVTVRNRPTDRWAAMLIGLELRECKVAVVTPDHLREIFEAAFKRAGVNRPMQFDLFAEPGEGLAWLKTAAPSNPTS
jgi:hypothetical protein